MYYKKWFLDFVSKNRSYSGIIFNVILYKFLMWRFCFVGRFVKSEDRNRSYEGFVLLIYL